MLDLLSSDITGYAVVLFLGWMMSSPSNWFERKKNQHNISDLEKQLHLKMKIDAKSMRDMDEEKTQLETQNENLRITLQTLQNKPSRAEYRLLYVYEEAINTMHAQAPGFSPVWQTALHNAEDRVNNKAGLGLFPLMKRAFQSTNKINQIVHEEQDNLGTQLKQPTSN